MPLVSIILPSYNHGRFLEKRLETIINQTFLDWELIIIDDCSTDDSYEKLLEFYLKNKSKVSHFIINHKNSGSGYLSWEKGIELSQSKYIWIAETDDYSAPNFLEKQVDLLEKNKQAVLSFCTSIYVDENENLLYKSNKRTIDLNVPLGGSKMFSSDKLLDKMPFYTYITNGSSVVFRKPINKIPQVVFEHKQISDIFLWTYLVNSKCFLFCNKPLNFFRRHKDSTTSKMFHLSLKNIYEERALYINYFDKKEKYAQYIKHYIEHYVWNNKKELLNTSIISKIEGVSWLKLKYYKMLLLYSIKRVFKKI